MLHGCWLKVHYREKLLRMCLKYVSDCSHFNEFAAEIFHGIQEEVMTTASRSNKLMIRLQNIESIIPSLEKTMLAPTSRIHFAYTSGREWHPRIPNEQSHFICYDLPRVVMDSYEECRDPPRLHLLDKFDIDGPGSCLKRYSDPTYFRRASGKPIEVNSGFQKDNNNGKIKKKKSLQRNRDLSCLASVAKQSGRKPFISLSFSGRTSSSKTASTVDTELKSDLQDHSRSLDSRSGSGYIEGLSTATSSVKNEAKTLGFSSSSMTPGALTIASVLSECHSEDTDDHFSFSPSREQVGRGSSCVSWDEKPEIMESNGQKHATNEAPEMVETSFDVEVEQDTEASRETERESGIVCELEMDSEDDTESEGETFVDALNTIDSESDNDYGFKTRREVEKNSNDITDERLEISCPTEEETEPSSNNDQTSCGNASEELIHRDSVVDLENHPRHSHLPAGKDVHDGSKREYDDVCDGSLNHLCNNSMDEHQAAETEAEAEAEAEAYHDDKPVTIWTNGNLLGLQPSKPPVFAEPKNEDKETEKADIVVGNHRQFQMVSSYTSEKASQPFPDPHASDEKSRGFDISHRFLMNGFRRKDSFARDRKIVPATIPENVEVAEEKTFEEPFRDDTTFDWLTSSPPLEHIKISFNPEESLQISRLKLKLPDGVHRHDGNKYTFSSFQLVPEPVTYVHDFDSDDDTFCRSTPNMSDNDYPSDDDSGSSSKHWEESTSEREDRKLYDSLHGSSHANHDAEPSSLSEESLNVPSFETLNPNLLIETRNSSVSENLSYLQIPAEPLPPPLPPVQWRASKESTERFEEKQQSLQDELKRALDKRSYLPTASQLSFTDPVKEEQPGIVSAIPERENNVHQKNNGREDKQISGVKEADAGDFLHQIRMKQFNLRRVVSTRPSTAAAATGLVPNTSINAILEKANSIRQAVACDDGDESDTWSDT
ncbi:PREDICTED: protein SCAR3-like isoform X2 [Tarenaya hassleriana]|uniref:protein SCAR3-like isoform X2 n=1 Tax=Tarenaya hassleriana TaxID=28532 RepID=UPI00053C99D9|nr:PREDICTED: protein SCAR3-like isoform X2 [Tarenaya hassleriana]